MKLNEPTLIITGFMGAGKTMTARAVAREIGCDALDLDEYIVAREKQSIAAIIDEKGEEIFRRIETGALGEVLKGEAPSVIALGGGTWTFECNRALIREAGALVVWLDAPFEVCWQRIMESKTARPLARERDSALRLYDARKEFYSLADLRIDANDEKPLPLIVAEIIEKCR
jgi:shikimate kinase